MANSEWNGWYIEVHCIGSYSTGAYSFNLTDTSGKLPDMLIGSIPEVQKGITGAYVFILMMEEEGQHTWLTSSRPLY